MHAQGVGTHERGGHRGLAKGGAEEGFCLLCSPYGSVCIHRSHVVTCAFCTAGDGIPRARPGSQSNRIPGNSCEQERI